MQRLQVRLQWKPIKNKTYLKTFFWIEASFWIKALRR